MRVKDSTLYQWHEDRRITRGMAFVSCGRLLIDDDDKTLSFSHCLILDLVQQRDSRGHLAEAQHDPSRYRYLTSKHIHVSFLEIKLGQTSSVSKSNWLRVVVLRFLLYWVRVYSIDSSKMMGNCHEVSNFQPVISQTPLVIVTKQPVLRVHWNKYHHNFICFGWHMCVHTVGY